MRSKFNNPITKSRSVSQDDKVFEIYKLMAGIGYVLNKISDLRQTSLYTNTLKYKLNLAYNECDNIERKICQHQGTMTYDESQQMADSYIVFENLLDCVQKIPENRVEKFNKHLEEVIKIYTT
jgi:hypothetical protein